MNKMHQNVFRKIVAKIVPTFCSASLIKNDHDEQQQLFILTEFGYKDINGRSLSVKRSIFGMLTGKNNQQF